MPKIVIIMSSTKKRAVLDQSLIPAGKSRSGWIGLGFAIQTLFLTAVVVIPLLFPNAIQFLPQYRVTRIETPVIQPWIPQPRHVVAPTAARPEIVEQARGPGVLRAPKPALISPVISAPVKKAAASQKIDAPQPPQIARDFPNQDLSSIGGSAIPTLRKPRQEVQTGEFGDPNGVPVKGNGKSSPNVAQLGGYDLPNGPGNGNGRGGANGGPGTTFSTGFGDGHADGPASHGRGSIQQGMFADAGETTSGPKLKPIAAVTSRTKPVQILSKPKPKYTEEARAKQIEGDVLLQVLFRSSGAVEVERVVRGLGYGLDESAQAAAREIRFEPALQEGHPVDSSAIVHITFALAY
jgi:TonB family protein